MLPRCVADRLRIAYIASSQTKADIIPRAIVDPSPRFRSRSTSLDHHWLPPSETRLRLRRAKQNRSLTAAPGRRACIYRYAASPRGKSLRVSHPHRSLGATFEAMRSQTSSSVVRANCGKRLHKNRPRSRIGGIPTDAIHALSMASSNTRRYSSAAASPARLLLQTRHLMREQHRSLLRRATPSRPSTLHNGP